MPSARMPAAIGGRFGPRRTTSSRARRTRTGRPCSVGEAARDGADLGGELAAERTAVGERRGRLAAGRAPRRVGLEVARLDPRRAQRPHPVAVGDRRAATSPPPSSGAPAPCRPAGGPRPGSRRPPTRPSRRARRRGRRPARCRRRSRPPRRRRRARPAGAPRPRGRPGGRRPPFCAARSAGPGRSDRAGRRRGSAASRCNGRDGRRGRGRRRWSSLAPRARGRRRGR